jgi:hypothetical protein
MHDAGVYKVYRARQIYGRRGLHVEGSGRSSGELLSHRTLMSATKIMTSCRA